MPPSSTTDPFVDDEINLRDYWRVLVRRRSLVLGITCIAVLTTAIFTLLQANVYQSKATLMPLGKSSGALQAALGELGGLLLPGLSTAAKESPTERMLAILQSRTLAEDVIQRLDLLPRLFAKKWNAEKQQWQTNKPPTMQDAVRVLGTLASVVSDKKTGVIIIAVEHTDPALAATIANQYIDALQSILNDNAFSLAKKNRLFIEAQVQKTRQDLTAAEEALQQFEQKHKIVALDVQAQEAVKAIAALQGEVMAREVQLGVLQRSVTGASREVALLQEELQGLRLQLTRLQHGTTAPHSTSGKSAQNNQTFPSLEEAPEIKLLYTRLQRDALIQNKLFTLLVQQLEQARIEEAQDEMAFQVLDQAIPSDKKIKPKRTMSVILATVVGAFLGVFAAFLRASLDPTIHSREQVEHQVGISVLAIILPQVPQRRRRRRLAPSLEADLVLHQPRGTPLVETYHYLYTRLQHHNNGRGMRTVLFTSPELEPDNAIPTILTNLAVVAASAGEKTLLVDSNLRQPTIHRLLQCLLAPGLSDILANPAEWPKGIQTTAVANLHFLPAGTTPPATFITFHSLAFDSLLAHCRETYDLILFAAPPVLGLSDAAILSGKVDITCLVLTCGVSRLESVVETQATLEAVHGNVVGAVLRSD